MAWIDCERTGIFQIGFCFGGRRVKRSLRTRDQRVAEAAMHRVEENIRLVTTGRLTIPLDADVASFLISDGKLATKESALPKIILLVRKRYRHLFPHRKRIELERVFGATTGEVDSLQSQLTMDAQK